MGNQLTLSIVLRSENDSCESVDLNIESRADVSMAIEFLERMYDKATEANVPRETFICEPTDA